MRHTLRFAQVTAIALAAAAPSVSAQTAGKKPNILVIWGDDIGQFNLERVMEAVTTGSRQ